MTAPSCSARRAAVWIVSSGRMKPGAAVEYGRVAVLDAVLREALGERVGVEHLVVEVVLGDGLQDGGHLLVLGRPHQQASGQAAQLAAGLLLEPLPQGVGVLEERDVPGVLEVGAAEDPGLAAGGAAVVAGGEAVVADDLGAAGRQPPGGLAAHRSDADDGDALPGSYTGFPFVSRADAGRPACGSVRFRMRLAGARALPVGPWLADRRVSQSGSLRGSFEVPCHIVERCARIWHENGSGVRGESRGCPPEISQVNGGNRMEMKSVTRSLRDPGGGRAAPAGDRRGIDQALRTAQVDRAAHAGHPERGRLAAGQPQGHHPLGDRRARARRTTRGTPGLQPVRRRARTHDPPPGHGERDHPPLGAGRAAVHGGRGPGRLRPRRTDLPRHRRHLAPARHRRRGAPSSPICRRADVEELVTAGLERFSDDTPDRARRSCAPSWTGYGPTATRSTATSTGRASARSPPPCWMRTARPWQPSPSPCPSRGTTRTAARVGPPVADTAKEIAAAPHWAPERQRIQRRKPSSCGAALAR